MTTILRPFQEKSAEKAKQFNLRCLMSLSTGLGKTVVSLVCVKRYLKRGPVIVVCPAVVKINWAREAKKHIGTRAVILYTRTPPRGFGEGHKKNTIYVINYDILGPFTGLKDRTWTDVLIRLKPQLIIIDECQALRGRRTLRCKAVKALCREVPHVMALSGTPLVNRPSELWPTLNVVRPDLYPTFSIFGDAHCGKRWTPWGWKYDGASNLGELHRRMRRELCIRFRKEDVLKELPTMQRIVVPIELPPIARQEYDEAVQNFLVWLAKTKRVSQTATKVRRAMKAERLTQLGYLLRLAGELKLPFVQQWVGDYLDSTDGKLIVFGIHKKVVRPLAEAFRPLSVVVDGSVTGHHRQQAIDKFNNGSKCRLLVGNIDAAGVGWNCTSTSTAALAEIPWTPGQVEQASNRLHGIERGLPGARAQVFLIVAADTVDEYLCRTIIKKKQVIDAVLDGGPTGELDDVMSQVEKMLQERVVK